MTYKTIQGDTWDFISHKLFGTSSHMVLLMKANPQHARTVVFSAGVILNVPSIPNEVKSDLPPWKVNANE